MRAILGRFCIIVLALICTLAIGQPAVATDHFTITIDESNADGNQELIFNETNIGPGFHAEYPVNVKNQSSSSVKISLYSLSDNPANTLFSQDLDISLSHNNQELLSNKDSSSEAVGSICIGPRTNDTFMVSVDLDSNYGNDYQNLSFLGNLTFNANAATCVDTPSGTITPPSDNPNILPQLPNTGESRFLYQLLACMILVFTITTIVSLILLILSRHKEQSKEKYEKN